jgi:hypothetical protein
MIDILKELHEGSITIDQAYDIYNNVMDTLIDPDIAKQIGLTDIEWTAYCHGVTFDVLEHWRYEGWPNTCSECQEKIIITQFGWFAIEENDKWVLLHNYCLEKAFQERDLRG